MPGRIVNIVVCEGCATERIAPDFLFNRTDDLEFSVKFDEDKEDGDDELTVEEDEDEDELEVEDEEDEEDEASEGFGHELEVEKEEEEDEVLISHLSIAKSQIRLKVSIRLQGYHYLCIPMFACFFFFVSAACKSSWHSSCYTKLAMLSSFCLRAIFCLPYCE